MGRQPPWLKNAAYKSAYLVFNLAMISVLYGTRASVLFNQETGEVDRGVEFLLWGSILWSWVTYMWLQGSEPGYINRAMVIGGSGATATTAGPGPVDVVTANDGQPADSTTLREPSGQARDEHPHGAHEGDSFDLLERDDSDFDPERPGAISDAARDAVAGHRDCKWCHARQPARAHHCRQCNKCVALFDHHCMWINTCIGERNRCRFWWYLLSQSSALAVAIGMLNTGFVWRRSTGDWVGANLMQLISLVVLWALQLFVFGLLVLHSWLACTNTTTYEASTGSAKLWYLAGSEPQDCDLPYSKGLCTNLRLFCCVMDAGCSAVTGCVRRSKGPWVPTVWTYPGRIDRDSPDVFNNLWSNKYYSCC